MIKSDEKGVLLSGTGQDLQAEFSLIAYYLSKHIPNKKLFEALYIGLRMNEEEKEKGKSNDS